MRGVFAYSGGGSLAEWSKALLFLTLNFWKKLEARVRIRVGAWLGRLDMWLGLCPNDLLTSCAMLTGSVGLIGDGYQYNTGKLRPGHADHFEYFVAKWLSTALEIESVVATGVGSTTLNKSLALVAGVFITALPASVSMAGHPSIHPNLKDGENAYWILLELHFTHFFFMRSTDNFKKAKSNFFLTL